MGERPTKVAERDELEVASVGERDQRVVRRPIGVLAAGRHGETAPAMVGDRRIQIAGDEDDVVELAEHRRMCITAVRESRP